MLKTRSVPVIYFQLEKLKAIVSEKKNLIKDKEYYNALLSEINFKLKELKEEYKTELEDEQHDYHSHFMNELNDDETTIKDILKGVA